jgi:hypothetical protein
MMFLSFRHCFVIDAFLSFTDVLSDVESGEVNGGGMDRAELWGSTRAATFHLEQW